MFLFSELQQVIQKVITSNLPLVSNDHLVSFYGFVTFVPKIYYETSFYKVYFSFEKGHKILIY